MEKINMAIRLNPALFKALREQHGRDLASRFRESIEALQIPPGRTPAKVKRHSWSLALPMRLNEKLKLYAKHHRITREEAGRRILRSLLSPGSILSAWANKGRQNPEPNTRRADENDK